MKPKRVLVSIILLLVVACVAQPVAGQTPTPTPKPAASRTLSWWDKALIVLGVSPTPRNQKGEEKKQTGRIFVVKLDADLEPGGRWELDRIGGGYRSPVLLPGGEKLLAIKEDKIVEISISDQKVKDITTIKGIIKLVGVSGNNIDEVLILADVDEDNCPSIGFLSLNSKEVTPLAHGWNEEDSSRLNELKGWNREYSGGDITLREIEEKLTEETGSQKREFTWVNVYLQLKEGKKINISDCKKINCVQPTFIAASNLVAYIKVE